MPLSTKFFNPKTFDDEEIYTRQSDLGDPTFKSAASESAKGLRRGAANVRSGVLSQRAAFNELTGDTEERDELERRAAEAGESARGFEARVGDYRDIEGVEDAFDFAVGGMFESLPFMAPAIVGGAAGRKIAGKLGASVRAKNTATTAGAFAGLASPETGFTYEEIKSETGERDPYRAFAAGLSKAALDTFSLSKGIGGVLGKGGVKDVLATGAREGVTESMQEGIDILTVRDAKGEPIIAPLGGEHTARLVNAGLLGAAAGAGFSTTGKATKRAMEMYRGKNPNKTLDEMLREGAMDEDGSINVPTIGGKISFSKVDADEVSEDEVQLEDFGELEGVVAFSDPDIMLNDKGMPWVSTDMYKASGIQNPGDALARHMQRLNMQATADSAIYKSELEKLRREGGTPEQEQALFEEHSPYIRVPYRELVARIAEVDGITLDEARDQVVSTVVKNNPRFESILSEAGPDYILDNLNYIEKSPEFKSEEISGFSDTQIYGEAKTKERKAIIREPKFTKQGVRYSGEVPVEVTSKTGKRVNKTVNLPNLVKYSMYSVKRKEGQPLVDYVSEALYSGLAELQVGRLEANVSAIVGESEKAKTKAEIERENAILADVGEKSSRLTPKGLTLEEKENIVVYTEFRNGKTVNQVTLAEVERSGTGRTKSRINALNARRQRINKRASQLKQKMQDMEMNIAMFGMSPKAAELKTQWMKARDDFETLGVDLERAFEDHALAISEEEKRVTKTARAKDIDKVKDTEDFEVKAGESAAETGVPEHTKKKPVDRQPARPWFPEIEGFNNFDMAVERFEKHMSDGDYKSAVQTFEAIIQGLEGTKQFLLKVKASSALDVKIVREEFYKLFPDEMVSSKEVSTAELLEREIIMLRKEGVSLAEQIKPIRKRLDAIRKQDTLTSKEEHEERGLAEELLGLQRRLESTRTKLQKTIKTRKDTSKEAITKVTSTGVTPLSMRDLVEKINGKIWGLNKQLDAERARLSNVGQKPVKGVEFNKDQVTRELTLLRTLRDSVNTGITDEQMKALLERFTKSKNTRETIDDNSDLLRTINEMVKSGLPAPTSGKSAKEVVRKVIDDRIKVLRNISREQKKPTKKDKAKFDSAIKSMHRDIKDIYGPLESSLPDAFVNAMPNSFNMDDVEKALGKYAQDRADTITNIKAELSRAGLEKEVYALDIAELPELGLLSYLVDAVNGVNEGFAGSLRAFEKNIDSNEDIPASDKIAMYKKVEEIRSKGYSQALFVMPINKNKAMVLDTIQHEVGHTILNHNRSKITGREAEAIKAEYEAWRDKFRREEDSFVRARNLFLNREEELVARLKNGELFTVNGTIQPSDKHIAYLEDFEEWFADKAKERLRSPAKAVSLVDRFFEGLVEAIRLFLDVSTGNYEGSAENFVDRLLGQHSETAWHNVRTATETLVDFAAEGLLTVAASEKDSKDEAKNKSSMFDQLDAYFNKTLGRGVSPAEIDKMLQLSGLGVTDAISAAFHNSFIESMDTLYTMEERNILLRAAKSPVVIRQLRRLLQPYPKAFEEVQADPEVAAAYMYQFWMTGHIKLGNKTKNNFYKAQGVLDDVLGIIHDQENAEHLMEEFVRGNVILSEQTGEKRYAIKQVIKDSMIKKAVHDYLVPMSKKLIGSKTAGGAFGSLFSAAQTRMMDTNNPYIVQLANMINPQVGQEGVAPAMIPSRNRRIAEYSNVAHDIFQGKSAKHGAAVISLLNSGKVVRFPKTEVEKDARRIQKEVMEPMHKYLKGAGLKVGKVENYFPWVFDIEYLTENQHSLKNLLNEKEFAKAMESIADSMTEERWDAAMADAQKYLKREDFVMTNAEAVDQLVSQIIDSGGYADVHHAVMGTGINRSNPQMSAINVRTLKFITDLGTKAQKARFGEFLSQNLGRTLITYIDQGVKRAEYNKRFGEKKGAEGFFANNVAAEIEAKTGLKEEFIQDVLIGEQWREQMVKYDAMVEAGQTPKFHPLEIEHPTKVQLLTIKAMEAGASKEEITLMVKYMDAVMGTLGKDTNRKLSNILGITPPPPGELINPKAQRLMGVAMVYQNVRLLSMAAITSLADPVGIAVRTGDIGMSLKSMRAGIVSAFKAAKGDKDTLFSMSEMLGVIDLEMTVDALNWEYGGVFMVGPEKKVNEAFFKYNLLQGLTRTTRIMAADAATRFIKKHVQKPDKNSARFLSELNIDAKDVKFDKDGKVVILSTKERTALYYTMKDGTPEQKKQARADFMADEKVRTAINSFVDTSILRPDATLRPIWASDPHFMLVFHLKSFMYAFSERILMRAYIEAQNSNTAPIIMLAMFVPAMLMADMLREFIRFGTDGNPRKQNWGWADYTSNAVSRAGLYGVGQLGDDIIRNIQYGGLGISPLLGPTLEQAGDIINATVSDTQDYDMIKALPAHSIYKEWGQ